MERITFDYSTKNIPVADREQYLTLLIERTEQFVTNLSWRSFFFLNPDARASNVNTYGFRSSKTAPKVLLLKPFIDALFSLIPNIQFRNSPSSFQNKLSKDLENLKKSEKLYVQADKTSNYYLMEKNEYNTLLNKQICSTYKKSNKSQVRRITLKDKRIATNLELDDRIEIPPTRNAFITLKDHKESFKTETPCNNPCRLINPFKSQIGQISKQILDRINKNVLKATKLNQWKCTKDVIKWFTLIPSKHQQTFITFDIMEFYPSISQDLLSKALEYASSYVEINDQEIDIIMHTKKTLLFNEDKPWVKGNNEVPFDVTMGSYDGAETCELVGTYILSKLSNICDGKLGLYRDDGLAYSNLAPREVENLKKKMCQVFRELNLKITIEANQKVTNFLDVTFDLGRNTYKPYCKPNNTITYVHTESNHPPQIRKNIPKAINNRLATISSDAAMFNRSIEPYQKALNSSGYKHQLKYTVQTEPSRQRRTRSRKVTWFNPPYSSNVATNIGRQFLQLIDRHFPNNHPLHSICNRNTLKISYCCLPSVGQIITSHNRGILNRPTAGNESRPCDCRVRENCPLQGRCVVSSVIYRAEVIRADNNTSESYVGVTEGPFKIRYNNHQSDFRNEHRWDKTELSKHIWFLRNNNINYRVKWSILKRKRAYSSASGRCSLCTYEKFIILCRPNLATLNKRSELAARCKHRARFKLENFK